MWRRRNSGDAWASIVGAHTPKVAPAGDAEVGQHVAASLVVERPLVLRGEALAAVLLRPGDAGVARPRTDAAAGRARRRAPRSVCSSSSHGERRAASPGRRRSRLAASHARAAGPVRVELGAGSSAHCGRHARHPRHVEELGPVPAGRAEGRRRRPPGGGGTGAGRVPTCSRCRRRPGSSCGPAPRPARRRTPSPRGPARRRRARRPRAAPAAAATRPVAISSPRLVSAIRCLSPWNEPIGRPKAMRSLAYCTAEAKSACMAPTDSAAVSTAASRPCPAISSSVAGPGVPTMSSVADSDAVEVEGAPGAGDVEAFQWPDRDAGDVGAHQHLGRAVGCACGEEHPSAVLDLGHHRDRAVEAEAVAVDREVTRDRLLEGPRRPRLPGDQLGEHRSRCGVGAADEGVDHHGVAGERSRLQAGPPLGGEHGGVEHAVARGRPATVGLVGEQAEPAELGRGGAVADVGARRRRRPGPGSPRSGPRTP